MVIGSVLPGVGAGKEARVRGRSQGRGINDEENPSPPFVVERRAALN